MAEIRILHLEDDPDWIFFVQERLKDDHRYRLTAVSGVNEAHALLETTFFHILIIDVILNPALPDDESGMDFVRKIMQTYAQVTEIIFLSNYAKYMRDAFREFRAADYIDKIRFEEDFKDALDRVAFDTSRPDMKLAINGRLRIRFQRGLSDLRGMITGLKYHGKRLHSDDPMVGNLTDELEDLLRRVFKDNETTILLESVGKGGFSGAGIVRCRPFSQVGGMNIEQQMVIMKFGDAETIRQEKGNHSKYVAPYQVATYATHIYRDAFSAHLGVLLYSFVGMNTRAFDDFDTFYTKPDTTSEQINRVLTTLFRERLGTWYAIAVLSTPEDLESEYRASLNIDSRLAEIKTHLQPYLNDGVLRLGTLPPLPNPLHRLERYEARVEAVYRSITHGDLNERNILIDPDTLRPWLIDFATTREDTPLLQDFAELEMAIRIELLREDDIPLHDRYRMEEMLTMKHQRFESLINALPDRLPWDAHPQLQKAYQAAHTLRSLAFDTLRRNQDATLYEYFVALYYYSINSLRFTTFSPLQRQHAMLSSALLAQALDQF